MNTKAKKHDRQPTADLRPTFFPGHIIDVELFQPLGVTQRAFCEEHGIEPSTFSRVLKGAQPITADTAIKFSKAFGLSEFFFMRLQERHDIEMAKRKLTEEAGDGRDQDDGPTDFMASA